MYDRIRILEIVANGESSVRNLWKRLLLFNFVPIFLAIFMVCIMFVFVSSEYLEVIIGALAIFTGFYFTLMVYVTDKASVKKKGVLESPNPNLLLEEFLENYTDFVTTLINQISYSVVLCLLIIILVFLTQIHPPHLNPFSLSSEVLNTINSFIYAFTHILLYFLLFKLLLFILLITSNMQAFFNEEFNSTPEKLQ